ncbi:hypothetical protein [Streptomyces sp. DH37]|uniref:SCO4402 family protein n=1 Tax=Streptomyces sp. DH37 TaxID=3040122 RepID=UPI0024434ED9|nr:hypothetical protein [Streptomyces sp. DH37]MDG9700910.1 hypothetical protein [Streptomyces sp. DH37]
MPPDDPNLRTPWLREQLSDWLMKLADRKWQEENWTKDFEDSELDDALDFFDDTGVLANPKGRVGSILVSEEEASALTTLKSALDTAISISASSDTEIIHSQEWDSVVSASREALTVMGHSSAREVGY